MFIYFNKFFVTFKLNIYCTSNIKKLINIEQLVIAVARCAAAVTAAAPVGVTDTNKTENHMETCCSTILMLRPVAYMLAPTLYLQELVRGMATNGLRHCALYTCLKAFAA